jgi:phosphonate transport system substrate-binding protein
MKLTSTKSLVQSILQSVIVVTFAIFFAVGCTSNKKDLGSEGNPIKLHFVPSVDAKVIENNSKAFKDYLEKTTGYKFEVTIPQSYVAVVEAFGTKRADIAAMNSAGYLLANEKYGAEARMTVIRHGFATYSAMFVAKKDGPIKKIEDLAGKKVAFVDPISTSGYILPLKMLKDKKIEPKETVFALKHDNVISMVYQGQVDGGAAFFSPPSKDDKGVEVIEDARRLVKTQYPDVEEKVAIIGMSDDIPNDPFIFRKDMPEEMKTKIIDAMMKFVETEDGKAAFKAIYGVTGLKIATDADYNPMREMLKTVGKSAEDIMKK